MSILNKTYIDLLEENCVRFEWALPLLTGSIDNKAEQRALALAMALGKGLEGTEAVDVAIAATAPELLTVIKDRIVVERRDFEAALQRQCWPMSEPDLTVAESGAYTSVWTQSNWEIWQDRALLAVPGRAPAMGEELPVSDSAAFEAWMRKECGATDESLERNERGGYSWGRTCDMWAAWEARACMALRQPGAEKVGNLSEAVTEQQMHDNGDDIEIALAAMQSAGRADNWPANMRHRINVALHEVGKAQAARRAAVTPAPVSQPGATKAGSLCLSDAQIEAKWAEEWAKLELRPDIAGAALQFACALMANATPAAPVSQPAAQGHHILTDAQLEAERRNAAEAAIDKDNVDIEQRAKDAVADILACGQQLEDPAATAELIAGYFWRGIPQCGRAAPLSAPAGSEQEGGSDE